MDMETVMDKGISRTRDAVAGDAASASLAASPTHQGADYSGRSRARFLIVFMLFLVTTVNYADRATLSITGSSIQKAIGISPVEMGYIFM